ncbi:MAG: hypothetical protein HY329_18705, partial [Chloroflexi bacterium]|nr:hypothetical protein [Chloroflexota bacterium]
MRFCLVLLCLVLLLACGESTPTPEHASAVVPNTATTTSSPAGSLETESATPASPGEPAVVHPTATPAPSPTPITTSFTPTVTLLPPDQQKPRLRDRPMLAAFVKGGRGWVADGRVILGTDDGGDHWNRLAELGEPVRSLAFVSATHGWASTDQTLLATRDGGRNWQPVQTALPEPFLFLQFVDDQHGWASTADPGQILASTDGGRTWNQKKSACPFPGARADTFSFVSAKFGWMLCAGSPGVGGYESGKSLFRTIDAAASWQHVASAGWDESNRLRHDIPFCGTVSR